MKTVVSREEYSLEEAIKIMARDDARGVSLLPYGIEDSLAHEYGVCTKDVLIQACSLGVLPERYSRNYSSYSLCEQKQLLLSHVGVVGMGGLGGNILEMLSRVGVGAITCADGDSFEASNLNRQAFSSESVLGERKAIVGRQRLEDISSATEYHVIDAFLTRESMEAHLKNVDVVIDALGGLQDKPLLVEVAHSLSLPIISASIAGLCGYVSYSPCGASAPTDWLGNKEGVESILGNLPQTVCFASSCIVQLVLDILLGRGKEAVTILFDIEKLLIQHVVV